MLVHGDPPHLESQQLEFSHTLPPDLSPAHPHRSRHRFHTRSTSGTCRTPRISPWLSRTVRRSSCSAIRRDGARRLISIQGGSVRISAAARDRFPPTVHVPDRR